MDSQQIAMAQAVHNARVVNAALDSCGATFDPEVGGTLLLVVLLPWSSR